MAILVCVWQGLIGLTTNPVLANGIAGLATSATAHAAVEVRYTYYQKVFSSRVWYAWTWLVYLQGKSWTSQNEGWGGME